MASLSLSHINKTYPNGFEAVKDFNLEIEDKEFIIFVGPSGCGKSTTLRMIAGLEEISSGTLKIGDKVMNDVEPKDRDIAMVFQNYALYPHMTVYDNMAFGLKLRKVPNKLLSWNQQVGSKFVNELVFFAFWILPVYEVAGLADILVINSIEFWSGSNPMAKGEKVIEGENGRYMVNCDGKGYTIKSEADGSVVRLDFDEADRSWSVNVNDESYKLMTFIDDSHVALPTPDGGMTIVELSQDRKSVV